MTGEIDFDALDEATRSTIERMLDQGPQVVTKNGTQIAIIISIADYDLLVSQKNSFKDTLMAKKI